MIETVDVRSARWPIVAEDDPSFVACAERLVAAAAVLGQQRDILVVRVDNWFGVRWLGFPKYKFRVNRRPGGVWARSKLPEDVWHIPPFHPNRVLSEQRYTLGDDGVVRGPFEPSQPLHRVYYATTGLQRVTETCAPGIYAWCSGNTKSNDRASLMVYTHTDHGTSGWYVEFRKTDDWRLSRRTCLGDAEWHQLLAIGGIADLE